MAVTRWRFAKPESREATLGYRQGLKGDGRFIRGIPEEHLDSIALVGAVAASIGV
jgi:hypothetical protein